MPTPRRRNFTTGSPDSAFTPTGVVGLAHVVLGAMQFATAGVLMFGVASESSPPAGLLTVTIALALVAGATVLAGLRIRDGERGGAILAIVLGVARLALLVPALLGGSAGLDAVITIALLAGAVWVLPTLTTRTGGRRTG